MDEGLLQMSAIEANKIVGYVESAKEEFFELDELGGEYSEIFQSLDKIEQYAEDYLNEIERKAEISLADLDQYPVEEAESFQGYLEGVSNSAEQAMVYNNPVYEDGMPQSREEGLMKNIREEIDCLSREVYGSDQDELHISALMDE